MNDRRKAKLFERAKKAGWISYITGIPDGQWADGRLLGVTDTGNRAGWDPLYEFEMEIRPDYGTRFRTTFRRIVAAGVVPNLQIGRDFRVIYDPDDHNQVSFVSFTSEGGETVDLRAFPVRLKHLGDTEMEPGTP
jgi:hypothetical protein